MFRLTAVALIVSSSSVFAQDRGYSCRPYQVGMDMVAGTTTSITGYLRKNEMLAGVEDLGQFRDITFVLVSQKPYPALLSNGTEACEYSDFTLTLNDQQLAEAQAWMDQGLLVQVRGTVQMAESSVEEYDNGVLVNITAFGPLDDSI